MQRLISFAITIFYQREWWQIIIDVYFSYIFSLKPNPTPLFVEQMLPFPHKAHTICYSLYQSKLKCSQMDSFSQRIELGDFFYQNLMRFRAKNFSLLYQKNAILFEFLNLSGNHKPALPWLWSRCPPISLAFDITQKFFDINGSYILQIQKIQKIRKM